MGSCSCIKVKEIKKEVEIKNEYHYHLERENQIKDNSLIFVRNRAYKKSQKSFKDLASLRSSMKETDLSEKK